MAYDKVKILEQAKAAIKKHELTTIEEVLSYIPCKQSILYEVEEWKLEVLEPIKSELDAMKVSLKAKMKKEWRKSESSPALQIAAFKLMASPEELNVLNTSKVQNEHSGAGGGPIPIENKHIVEFHDYSARNQPEV